MRQNILFLGVAFLLSLSFFYTFNVESQLNTMAAPTGDPEDKYLSQMTEADLIVLIDQRIAVLELRRKKNVLAELRAAYPSALPDTPSNKRIYGNPQARITLMEFGDVECTYCRKMHAGLKQTVDNSKGVINWEFKHFPLGGHNPAAANEARLIECAASTHDNQVAWILLDQLIAQTQGNGGGVSNVEKLIDQLGLSQTLMSSCMNSDLHKAKIATDYGLGTDVGVTATPAMIVIDNQTGKRGMVKGFKTREQILQAVQMILGKQ